jgi:hypothetical protein
MSVLTPSTIPHQFDFALPGLRGTICAEGQTHGFRELRFLPDGPDINNPKLYLGHLYRCLANGRFLVQTRDHPHASRLDGDKVITEWPVNESNPARIQLTYEVSSDNTLDLTATCTATAPVKRYELYFSHYFGGAFRPYLYLKSPDYLRRNEPVLYAPQVNGFVDGYYLAYPRDNEALFTLFDGRWHGDHPVPFCVGREFWRPIGIYAAALERKAVVITARQSECFCLYSTYDTPDARDNILHHNSLYFGMFNADLEPGESRTGHLRYHFVDWDTHSDLPLSLQQAWEDAAE